MIPALTADEIARFHSRLNRDGDCWTWTGELNSNGYGRFAIYRDGGRIRLLAHRIAYLLETGSDPGDLVVRHECDNPPCARGEHLITGTQSDNLLDAVRRGRTDLSGLDDWREQRSRIARQRLVTGTKVCGRCRIAQPIERFSINRERVDGRQNRCKDCVSAHWAATRGGLTERERRRITGRTRKAVA